MALTLHMQRFLPVFLISFAYLFDISTPIKKFLILQDYRGAVMLSQYVIRLVDDRVIPGGFLNACFERLSGMSMRVEPPKELIHMNVSVNPAFLILCWECLYVSILTVG